MTVPLHEAGTERKRPLLEWSSVGEEGYNADREIRTTVDGTIMQPCRRYGGYFLYITGQSSVSFLSPI